MCTGPETDAGVIQCGVGLLRLAFLAPEFYNAWGGVGTYSTELVKNLSRLSDMEVHLITPDIDDKEKKKRINSALPDSMQIHPISNAKDTFIYNLKFQAAVFKEFNKLHKMHNFELIHSANLVHMPDIFLKFKKNEIPSLVTAHTTIAGQVSGSLKCSGSPLKMAASEKMSLLAYPYIRFLEWHYLNNTQNIITVSDRFRVMLRDDYKFGGNLATINNGIDVEHYNFDAVETEDCIKKFPLLKGINKPIILFAGRILVQKGIDTLIKALSILERKGIGFFCIIAGRGNVKTLHQLIAEYKIGESSISYVGFVENSDLVYLYKMSDIFVLPSYYENFPISLLEAMSMKCCCISTDTGAVNEIIDNNENGLLIGAGDYKRLAERIEHLLADGGIMKNLAENGRKKVLAKFRADIMALKTKKFYEGILSKEDFTR